MARSQRSAAGAALAAVLLAGCGASPAGEGGAARDASSAPTGTPSSPDSPGQGTPTAPSPTAPASIEGTIVRFTAGDTVVEVTIVEDTPTTRDFLSMLPMTLPFEDYAGMEKIAYPPRGFDATGNPGMTPRVGDLFSYLPWGNLGFFTATGALGHSDQLVRIGVTDDLDGVMRLDGQDVTISIAG